MSHAMTTQAVTRTYVRADGAAVRLLYRELPTGVHRLAIQGDEVAVWNCDTIEAARTRWRVLAKRLREHGFQLEGRP